MHSERGIVQAPVYKLAFTITCVRVHSRDRPILHLHSSFKPDKYHFRSMHVHVCQQITALRASFLGGAFSEQSTDRETV